MTGSSEFGLDGLQTVFGLFFAIFWGLVANAQLHWKAFDWPMALAGRTNEVYRLSWRRIRWSVGCLTAVPVVLFVIIIEILDGNRPPHGGWVCTAQLLLAVVAAHAAFAPYRFWLARMQAYPDRYFYKHSHINSGLDRHVSDDEEKHLGCRYSAQPGAEPVLHLHPKWARSNFLTAVAYVVASLGCAFGAASLDLLY